MRIERVTAFGKRYMILVRSIGNRRIHKFVKVK